MGDGVQGSGASGGGWDTGSITSTGTNDRSSRTRLAIQQSRASAQRTRLQHVSLPQHEGRTPALECAQDATASQVAFAHHQNLAGQHSPSSDDYRLWNALVWVVDVKFRRMRGEEEHRRMQEEEEYRRAHSFEYPKSLAWIGAPKGRMRRDRDDVAASGNVASAAQQSEAHRNGLEGDSTHSEDDRMPPSVELYVFKRRKISMVQLECRCRSTRSVRRLLVSTKTSSFVDRRQDRQRHTRRQTIHP